MDSRMGGLKSRKTPSLWDYSSYILSSFDPGIVSFCRLVYASLFKSVVPRVEDREDLELKIERQILRCFLQSQIYMNVYESYCLEWFNTTVRIFFSIFYYIPDSLQIMFYSCQIFKYTI